MERRSYKAVKECLFSISIMTVNELIQTKDYKVLQEGADLNRKITVPFCCDLLSIAMGKMPAGSAWITVMGNINTLAVAALADAACIILAEDSNLDETALNKAKEQGITVLKTDRPIFETALNIYRHLND
jgi:predicted transcriptional regulator